MNRILTAAAALVASSAGVAGLTGTATADPAPGLPAVPPVHHSLDDGMGTLHAAMRSMGRVVPASERAEDGAARTGLPLLGQIRDTPLDPTLKAVGNVVGEQANPTAAAARPQQRSGGLSGSSIDPDPSGGSSALPGADMLGSLSGGNGAPGDLLASTHGPTANPVDTAGNLLGNLPVGRINALGLD